MTGVFGVAVAGVALVDKARLVVAFVNEEDIVINGCRCVKGTDDIEEPGSCWLVLPASFQLSFHSPFVSLCV